MASAITSEHLQIIRGICSKGKRQLESGKVGFQEMTCVLPRGGLLPNNAHTVPKINETVKSGIWQRLDDFNEADKGNGPIEYRLCHVQPD